MAKHEGITPAGDHGAATGALVAPVPLTAVWSRDVDTERLAGRPRMILAVRRAMNEACPVEHLRLSNLLERPHPGAVLWAAFSAAGELLHGRLPSLQCLLFADGGNHRRLRERLLKTRPETLYCDGVRSYYFLRRLGAMREQMRIVVDLDDLMSRRMELLGQSGLGLSLGYLRGRAPAWAIYLLTRPFVARLVASWESAALRHVEGDLGRWAHTVVLLSSIEGVELAGRYAQSEVRARVEVISPPTEISRPPEGYARFGRFIFIGTDILSQNYSAIRRLIDLWERVKPTDGLHIFGSMTHAWPETSGVVFCGYAMSLTEVYTEGTVLLAPGALRGGVKTKVLEAFSHGCAVAGNSITFEGLELGDYPLRLDEEAQFEELVLNPHAYLGAFHQAAVLGQKYVASAQGWKSFSAAWRVALGLDTASGNLECCPAQSDAALKGNG